MHMKFFTSVILGCLLLFTCPPGVFANESNFGIGAKVGTLGVGAEIDLGLNEMLRLRSGANYLNFSFDSTISNIDYEMEPDFKNVSLLLDWYPMGGAFRITGGLYINKNEVDLTGTPRTDTLLADYDIPSEYWNLEPYADTIQVKGSVDFNTFSPYLGIGWNSNVDKQPGWGVSFELGVLFQGSPSVSDLTASSSVPLLNSYADDPLVLQFLDEEKVAIEEDLEEFQYYPVASFMLHYNF